ncbi:MAG: hypothetical protein A2V87_08825 [Deltaproteobacteria bacterium RBG_16_58_17]|nr:MAG: hypothetical protein A2V87_08825 [Deltaproteobacteria bacterium RBG_16_58_17]OHE16638.1 MAG: hypothetical protein A2X96_09730 [Syntrophobacterales bacterium GWC2_56_13]OHE20883.1 MAG: hypothetical protein A2X95_06585 [Syntrophobacterales bacterium GWF2_56_9]
MPPIIGCFPLDGEREIIDVRPKIVRISLAAGKKRGGNRMQAPPERNEKKMATLAAVGSILL